MLNGTNHREAYTGGLIAQYATWLHSRPQIMQDAATAVFAFRLDQLPDQAIPVFQCLQ